MITAVFLVDGREVFRWDEASDPVTPEPWASRIDAALAAPGPAGYDPYPDLTALQQVADAYGAQLVITGEPEPAPDGAVE